MPIVRSSALVPGRDPTYAEIVRLTGDVSAWVSAEESAARFSRFHFSGPAAFALPFRPQDFVWSPVVAIPVWAHPTRVGHYRRGVTKYVKAVKSGQPIDPVAFLLIGGAWHLQDGNHRYEAHVVANASSIAAIFGAPKA